MADEDQPSWLAGLPPEPEVPETPAPAPRPRRKPKPKQQLGPNALINQAFQKFKTEYEPFHW